MNTHVLFIRVCHVYECALVLASVCVFVSMSGRGVEGGRKIKPTPILRWLFYRRTRTYFIIGRASVLGHIHV